MAHATCDCAEQIAKAYLAHNGHPAPDDNLEIFQTSLMSGLIAGVYESEMTLGELFSTVISVWVPSMTWMVN